MVLYLRKVDIGPYWRVWLCLSQVNSHGPFLLLPGTDTGGKSGIRRVGTSAGGLVRVVCPITEEIHMEIAPFCASGL